MRTLLLLTIILVLFGKPGSIKAGTLVAGTDAKPDTLPVPKNITDMKFYLQRDPNTNTIVYALNWSKPGTLNKDEPLYGFWIRYAENGEKKELNYVQRKFAYGMKLCFLE